MTIEVIKLYGQLLILLVIAGILKSPQFKGFMGELGVRLHMKRLDKEKYRVINDVTVKLKDGKTAQIDHIIVSNYGVFVIETKNYKGWIVGKEEDYYWKQVIYKRKEKLYNPLKQNHVHILRLKEILENGENIPFVSVIVFNGRADLKVVTSKHVIYPGDLISVIKAYESELLTTETVEKIYTEINSKQVLDKEVKKEHIQNIKSYSKTPVTSLEKCPKCGGFLDLKKGKYGEFKGCSNFPKCRYTASL